jgi:hypothetical protein
VLHRKPYGPSMQITGPMCICSWTVLSSIQQVLHGRGIHYAQVGCGAQDHVSSASITCGNTPWKTNNTQVGDIFWSDTNARAIHRQWPTGTKCHHSNRRKNFFTLSQFPQQGRVYKALDIDCKMGMTIRIFGKQSSPRTCGQQGVRTLRGCPTACHATS